MERRTCAGFADDLQHSETSYFFANRAQERAANGDLRSAKSKAVNRRLLTHSMELAFPTRNLERFSFIAAHDLRAPIRSIRISAQLLQQRSNGVWDDHSRLLVKQTIMRNPPYE